MDLPFPAFCKLRHHAFHNTPEVDRFGKITNDASVGIGVCTNIIDQTFGKHEGLTLAQKVHPATTWRT
jgi:hypothetical protein